MRSIAGTPARRNGVWSSKIARPSPAGKTAPTPTAPGRGAQRAPTARRSELPSRGRRRPRLAM